MSAREELERATRRLEELAQRIADAVGRPANEIEELARQASDLSAAVVEIIPRAIAEALYNADLRTIGEVARTSREELRRRLSLRDAALGLVLARAVAQSGPWQGQDPGLIASRGGEQGCDFSGFRRLTHRFGFRKPRPDPGIAEVRIGGVLDPGLTAPGQPGSEI